MKSQAIRKVLFFLLLIGSFGCFSQPQQQEPALEKYRQTKALLGTLVQIDVCHDGTRAQDIEESLGLIWELIGEIHWRMSVYTDKGDVFNVNHSYRKPVLVQADTFELIKEAIHFSELTRGAFDITVSPLIGFWKEAAEKNTLPALSDVRQVKSHIGVHNIRLSPDQTVELLTPETKIDLGGIAKGYAVDEAARLLRQNGFFQFYIDAGGDVYVAGRNCRNEPWRIGIRDPRNRNQLLDTVHVENAAVTTSGNYERFFEIQGKRFSHIINPITGFPQQHVTSATVIAPGAQDADALSTALTVLDPKEGIKLIDSLGGHYASTVVTYDEGKRTSHASTQYYRYLASPGL